MNNTWNITGDDRESVIESAVNTILGMTLVTPVRVEPRRDQGSTVHIVGGNGDTAIIHCTTFTEALQLALAIGDGVNTELEALPPFGLRHAVRIVPLSELKQ